MSARQRPRLQIDDPLSRREPAHVIPTAAGVAPAPRPPQRRAEPDRAADTVRIGVRLPADDIDFLRSLSRPQRTGGQRYLGANFVATGLLRAAVQLLRDGDIDMSGVVLEGEMVARARTALQSAAHLRS